jgi:flagellin-like protein
MTARHEQATEEAVSPIVAVLLMVAITIVVAATVYLFARGLAQPPSGAPVLSFNADDHNGYLTLVDIEPPGDSFWADFSAASDQAGDFSINTGPPDGADVLVPNVFVLMGGTPGGPADGRLANGALVAFCAEPGPMSGVSVVIRHDETRRQVYTHTFTTLPDCA